MKRYDPNKSYVMNQTKTIEGVIYESDNAPPLLPQHTLDLFLRHNLIREGSPVRKDEPLVEQPVSVSKKIQAVIQRDSDGYYIVYLDNMPRFKTDNRSRKSAIEWCEKNKFSYSIS